MLNVGFISRRLNACVSVFVALFCASAAFAATYVVPPDDVLAGRAKAIVIARALTSYAEESETHGIETVTVLSIEEVLKGDLQAGSEVKVRTIGGVLGKRAKVIPGSPRFKDGEQMLVFLNDLDSGDYATTDFGLGVFGYQTDDTGQDVLIRTATEIHGWNTDGTPHHEARRNARRFEAYLRGVGSHVPMKTDYIVESRPLIGEAPAPTTTGRLLKTTLDTLSPKYYTLASSEVANGFRWTTFPAAINWNRGNNATGASNNGSDAINVAFTSWNGDSNSNINYVLTTTNSNLNGIQQASDGVNNIVFEKVLTGISTFSCVSGGVLGLGGITLGFGDPSNLVGGDEFFATNEGDVSMNIGVNACIGGSLSVGDFNSAVTHEVGHTLGLRHSDKTRDNTASCPGTYDCASSDIMTAVVTFGLSGALQAWDHRAVAAIYPAPAVTYNPPTSVEAHAISSTQAQVNWVLPIGGTTPSRYNVYRTQDNSTYTFAGFATHPATSFTDTVSTNKAYIYKVRSADSGGTTESVDSNKDLATVVAYINPTLTGGSSTIQAVDINQLRTAVDAVRTLYGIGLGFYTYLPATGGATLVHADDINQLRTNLNTAINGLFGTTPTYTNTITAGTSIIRALDFTELRNVMR